MFGELFGREDEPLVGRGPGSLPLGIVKGIDDELAFDWDRPFLGVVKVDSPPKAAGRRLTRLRVHRRRPDHHDLGRLLVDRLLLFVVADPGERAAQVRQRRLAASGGQKQQR